MLIIHFIGLAMGLGTSFAFMFLGMSAAKMEKEEARKFSEKIMIVSRMGHIGLTLLIVSGIFLMSPYWQSLPEMPLLIAKLTLVVMLAILIVLIGAASRKAAQTKDEKYEKQVATLGKLSFLTALSIVVLAVYIFH